MPAFDAEYAPCHGRPRMPAADDTMTSLPRPASAMAGVIASTMWMVPIRLMSMQPFHFSCGRFVGSPHTEMPAAWCTSCGAPCLPTSLCAHPRTASQSDTSRAVASTTGSGFGLLPAAARRAASMVLRKPSPLRSAMATRYPSPAREMARARPMPEAAPVTMAKSRERWAEALSTDSGASNSGAGPVAPVPAVASVGLVASVSGLVMSLSMDSMVHVTVKVVHAIGGTGRTVTWPGGPGALPATGPGACAAGPGRRYSATASRTAPARSSSARRDERHRPGELMKGCTMPSWRRSATGTPASRSFSP